MCRTFAREQGRVVGATRQYYTGSHSGTRSRHDGSRFNYQQRGIRVRVHVRQVTDVSVVRELDGERRGHVGPVGLVAVLVVVAVVTDVRAGAPPAPLQLRVVFHGEHDRLHAAPVLGVVLLHVHYVEHVRLGRLHVGHLCGQARARRMEDITNGYGLLGRGVGFEGSTPGHFFFFSNKPQYSEMKIKLNFLIQLNNKIKF